MRKYGKNRNNKRNHREETIKLRVIFKECDHGGVLKGKESDDKMKDEPTA